MPPGVLDSCLIIALMLASVPDSVFDNPSPWKASAADGELKFEERPIKDSPFSEYRLTTTTDVSVEALCKEVFDLNTKDKEKLKNAPKFEMSNWSECCDSTHLLSVYRHYGEEHSLRFIHHGNLARDGQPNADGRRAAGFLF